ncbi:MAG: arsenate reductase (glutaredoxin) [Alphaproteobacteria bacterium]|nr:arsenate reductase (glutaredoxin) [Alphaproteobacteria bacterium]MDE1985205.1 arsenate reductase (glutaredoxin) [Alphaproteobacteria bacterium]MDE2162544.1 arsenate reductase (glutaredoxin) [Alphaproteobacteria bacterium]MDE2265004.1 arsenate reductase (glutaredoxin) [Alphaproteobacteria bacterium]MDE2499282.1 arsenate reductase (glutaredoxin) [Alphaproteobacteria bacterium]
MQITIYHNPNCGTSRNTLAAIRAAGYEPRVVEYLKTPPTREELKELIVRMKVNVRDVVRKREPLYRELRLDERDVGENELLDAMIENPILINRPIVVTEKAVRLCRPSELVKEMLTQVVPEV